MVLSQHSDISLDFAQGAVERGEVLIVQTDTLFGLVCDATSVAALDKLMLIKCRGGGKQFPIFVQSYESAVEIAVFNKNAAALAKAFWPGALTIILNLKEGAKMPGKYFRETIALRVPKNNFLLQLLRRVKCPLTATSANISNMQNPSDLRSLLEDEVFSKIGTVLIDKHSSIGSASTLVDCTTQDLKIVRVGAVGQNDILECIS